MTIKPFYIELRVRNNYIRERRLRLGLTHEDVARGCQFSITTSVRFETLYLSPVTTSGNWTPSAIKLADFYGVMPKDLWPPEILAVQKPVQGATVDMEEIQNILQNHEQTQRLQLPSPYEYTLLKEQRDLFEEGKKVLTPRQRKVIELRAEGATLQELSKEMSISRERVRQVEARAIRKIQMAVKYRREIEEDEE